VLASCAWAVFDEAPVPGAGGDARCGDYDDPFEPLTRVVECGYFVERFDADGIALIAASL
jgi:hypothetical protein